MKTIVEQLLEGVVALSEQSSGVEELTEDFYKQLEMEYEYENYLIQLELSEYYGLFGPDDL